LPTLGIRPTRFISAGRGSCPSFKPGIKPPICGIDMGELRGDPALSSSFDFFWVDAFSASPFGGNPAVVCVLERNLTDETLQKIAREFNVSETVFISRRGNHCDYDIRWFTPTVEVDLVGHATLAAAYVIMGDIEPGLTDIVFHSSRSGLLRAYGDRSLVSIDLPADAIAPCEAPAALLAGLGMTPARVLKGRHYVAVMSSVAEVRISPSC
jgi:PhzF family phenazine biosynthesis protein